MKFKVDENLPAEIAVDLRGSGHDADTVFDQGLVGSPDTVIMSLGGAQRQSQWTPLRRFGNGHPQPLIELQSSLVVAFSRHGSAARRR
jgi:hypothetical protein